MAARLALNFKVPMRVKNTMAPDLPGQQVSTSKHSESPEPNKTRCESVPGTQIVPELGPSNIREDRVRAISFKKSIAKVDAWLKVLLKKVGIQDFSNCA